MPRAEQADGLTRSGQTLTTLREANERAALPRRHVSRLGPETSRPTALPKRGKRQRGGKTNESLWNDERSIPKQKKNLTI